MEDHLQPEPLDDLISAVELEEQALRNLESFAENGLTGPASDLCQTYTKLLDPTAVSVLRGEFDAASASPEKQMIAQAAANMMEPGNGGRLVQQACAPAAPKPPGL